MCVCVRTPLTQSGVSNCPCPAQSDRAPLFVSTALNQLQQTRLSDEARGHVFCPGFSTCQVSYLLWNNVSTSAPLLINLHPSRAGCRFESATTEIFDTSVPDKLVSDGSRVSEVHHTWALHGLILLSLISLCSSSDIFLRGGQKQSEPGEYLGSSGLQNYYKTLGCSLLLEASLAPTKTRFWLHTAFTGLTVAPVVEIVSRIK